MIVEEQKQILKTIKKTICDDCGKPAGTYHCSCCKKDLCKKCIAHTIGDDYTGDYNHDEFICKDCWNKLEPYYDKIHTLDKIIKSYDIQFDEIDYEIELIRNERSKNYFLRKRLKKEINDNIS